MMSELGIFIKERLSDLEMSQSDLAKKLNVGTGQVSMWANGKTTPAHYVQELADALECSEGELTELMEKTKATKRKGGGGRQRSADWQFDLRENYDLTLPEEKPSNGNGGKAISPAIKAKSVITPPITSKVKPNGLVLRAKISILENAAAVRGMLAVARLVGDERTIEVTKMVEEKIGNIEAEARGLDE